MFPNCVKLTANMTQIPQVLNKQASSNISITRYNSFCALWAQLVQFQHRHEKENNVYKKYSTLGCVWQGLDKGKQIRTTVSSGQNGCAPANRDIVHIVQAGPLFKAIPMEFTQLVFTHP